MTTWSKRSAERKERKGSEKDYSCNQTPLELESIPCAGGLIVPAAFAILPYSVHLQNAYNQQDITTRFGWEVIVINTLVNSLLIVILGGIGLAFGRLFWMFGLESAMLAHFFTATLQDETGRILATACVVAMVLLALVWAWRTFITENRKYPTGNELEGD